MRPARLRILVLALACLAVLPAGAGAVIGGRSADRSDYPYFVRLRGCGGTLVAPDRILTAAHCIPFLTPGASRLRVGTEIRTVTKIAQHPGYRAAGRHRQDELPDDVGIIALDQPVTTATPVPIVSPRSGAPAVLIGLGVSRYGGGGFGTFRKVSLQIRPDSECRSRLHAVDPPQARNYDPRSMVCTIDPDGRPPYRSGCNGDSGSPLLMRNVSGTLGVTGVDSWGIACGTSHGDPEIFSQPSAVRAFIRDENPPWYPAPAGRVSLPGPIQVGTPATCAIPPWVVPPRRVQIGWLVDDEEPMGSFDKPTYTPRSRDEGRRLQCVAFAENRGGSLAFYSTHVTIAPAPAPPA